MRYLRDRSKEMLILRLLSDNNSQFPARHNYQRGYRYLLYISKAESCTKAEEGNARSCCVLRGLTLKITRHWRSLYRHVKFCDKSLWGKRDSTGDKTLALLMDNLCLISCILNASLNTTVTYEHISRNSFWAPRQWWPKIHPPKNFQVLKIKPNLYHVK